jgi:hypothetical protein
MTLEELANYLKISKLTVYKSMIGSVTKLGQRVETNHVYISSKCLLRELAYPSQKS